MVYAESRCFYCMYLCACTIYNYIYIHTGQLYAPCTGRFPLIRNNNGFGEGSPLFKSHSLTGRTISFWCFSLAMSANSCGWAEPILFCSFTSKMEHPLKHTRGSSQFLECYISNGTSLRIKIISKIDDSQNMPLHHLKNKSSRRSKPIMFAWYFNMFIASATHESGRYQYCERWCILYIHYNTVYLQDFVLSWFIYVFLSLHLHMHACMPACMHTDIQAYRHTDIQTYRHTNIPAYMQTCIHTIIHTYNHTYTYIHTYIDRYIHT